EFASLHGGHDLALEQLDGALEFIAIDREREVGGAGHGLVLHDHVDVDVGGGHGTQDGIGNTGFVGHGQQSDLCFVAAEGDAGDNGGFHFFVFLKSNQRARSPFDFVRNEGGGQGR